jgi:serine/threonine protein phosphatase PrpC
MEKVERSPMQGPASEQPWPARYYVEQDMLSPDVFPFLQGEVAVFSCRCPGKPTPCEDSAAVVSYRDDAGILIVADGLGGQPAGDQASSRAVRCMEQSLLAGAQQGQDLREAILNGFETANCEVSRLMLGAATTLAVVEIQGGIVRPYHVGDSVIMAVGQRGRIKLQTVSHSPVGYAVEAGFLDQEEAMHHSERHLVSNFLGSSEMHITIGHPLELSDLDTLLVATDGLADNLHVREIVESIRKGRLERVARQLTEEAIHRMTTPEEGRPSKPDDLTFIVYRPRKGGAVRRKRQLTGAI